MELGLLVLRLIVGLLMMGHGAQKLFGMFGGYGIRGTGGFFESLGLKPGHVHAFNAGAAEFAGGALLALGLLTPLAAALIIGTMTVAIATVHYSKGVWSTEGGYEYNLVLIATTFAVAATGPGKWSLDHAFSIDANGADWALAALGLGVIGGVVTLAFGRMQAARAKSAGPSHPTAT
jgi:putative oxidoreductase